jgi:1,4-alpha-glucan branching enzyme
LGELLAGDRSLSLVLHGHLPWCIGEPVAEAWLVEAVVGCYLPLLEMLHTLEKDSVSAPLALSLSPPLVAMLDHPGMRRQIGAALDAAASSPLERWPAHRFHRQRAAQLLTTWGEIREDVPGAFYELSRRGRLELFGCAATHGYLPLLSLVPEAARAQVAIGAELFERRFGARLNGMWLPECGFTPGAETWLASAGVRWTVLDAPQVEARGHAFLSSGTAVMVRDTGRCAQVWSAESGYPGHPDHLDFHHRDEGARVFKVTGREDKEPWVPERAQAQARADADDFFEQLAHGRPGLTVAAFDAELFGHWWFEGPWFLDALLRRCAKSDAVQATTPSAWLAENPEGELVAPQSSSWGKGGFHATWLNETNQRLWPGQLRAAERMVKLTRSAPPGHERALSALANLLLLAQASDWPFLLDAHASTAIAMRRVEGHLADFLRLSAAALEGDWSALDALDSTHNPLGEVDFRVYR